MRAVENDGGQQWETLDTLAAACAESGDFGAAQRCETEALRLAPPEGQGELQDRLELYRKQQPYRLPAQDR
ncbi:MAG: hypothetical protein WD847_11730 [Pirellulales bacterium]